jgi:hypothetical protein
MYMLLAVLAAGAMLALIHFVRERSWPALLVLVLLEAAGLYTHYSFVFVVFILNLGYVLQLRPGRVTRQVWPWTLSQLAVVLLFLPWLPTAVRQVTTWPSPVLTGGLLPALANTWRWLVFGPTIETSQVAIPLLLAGILAIAGALFLWLGWVGKPRLDSRWSAVLVSSWLGLPVILMLGLGLYREAYLKFLLVTTPAVCLLLSCGLLGSPQTAARNTQYAIRNTPHASRFTRYASRALQLIAALVILVPTAVALRNYYADPAYARDDYRSIAAYIEAVGQPGDAVLLNAPGQQEVFGYYYDGRLPVYPLPEGRPLDPITTAAALVELAKPGGRVFALLWATGESDPERFVEGWLDSQAYKALDSWYGNVRLVVYAVPEQVPSAPDYTLGIPLKSDETADEIALLGYSLLNDRLAAGDIAQITLFWQAGRTPVQRYKVFLHALDESDQIVGQRDGEPGGGARLTTLWQPGEAIADNHGLPIHPATPPGEYRLEVGIYDPETGRRLTTPDSSSQVWLAPLTVERPAAPPPSVALGMQHREDARLGELTLLGYDTYRLGFAHKPEAILQPGDVLHVNLYWRAEAQPSGDWQIDLSLLDTGKQERASVSAEPVGGYPTSQWQAGDVWRGQFSLPLPAGTPAGWNRLRIQILAPDGTSWEMLLSEPVRVES